MVHVRRAQKHAIMPTKSTFAQQCVAILVVCGCRRGGVWDRMSLDYSVYFVSLFVNGRLLLRCIIMYQSTASQCGLRCQCSQTKAI